MTMPQSYVGVDVSKSFLDIHWLETGRSDRQPNTDFSNTKLASKLAGAHVIFEASGGYEISLAIALAEARVVLLLVECKASNCVAQKHTPLAD